jgi:hypothetical protein
MQKKIYKIMILLFLAPAMCQAELLVFEDFESGPLNQPYPWNGSNNDNWYDWAYNRAVPISNFPEHFRDFLGNNVLYINEGESYHLISSQILPVRFEYDLLFHYSEQSPSGFGAIFGQSIIVNEAHLRGGIIGLQIQKDYSHSFAGQDGIYWAEQYDDNWHRISEIIPDTWYHLERIINPNEQVENIKITNRDTLQEFNFTYEIITPINSIEGFSLGTAYSPSYSLMDNLIIETIPEPATLFFVLLGAGLIRKTSR